MKYLVTILFVLSFGNLHAQIPIDSTNILKWRIADRLKSKGINEFIFFIRTGPSPKEVLSTDSDVALSYVDFDGYAFWKENSKSFMQRFDCLGEYQPQEMTNFEGLAFASQNHKKIKVENILPYQILSNGKKETLVTPIHYDEKISFYIGDIKFEKQFFTDGLDDNDYDDPKMANINYQKNTNLKITQLYKMCLVASEGFIEQ